MNTKFIAATVIAIASMTGASAFAQNNLYGEAALVVPQVASSSSATRAQVQSEYLQARQQNALPASPEAAFVSAPAAPTNVSRSSVRGEAIISARAAQAAGNSTL